ncbi:MAG TPA: PQQ-binding-like beta-propeller repeat protein, partial [Chloroflexota bacterium]|nr:PQQ-binding-like beta-propeller repeat protein [Chloroflexota bacterium]
GSRSSRLRVAAYACAATVLVAALTAASYEALQHLGGDQNVVVITDDTASARTPGQTVSQAPESTAAIYRGNLERTGVYPSGGPTGPPELLWKSKLPYADRDDWVPPPSPVISEGVLYIGAHYSLYAFDAQSGRQKWEFPTASWVRTSPAVAGGVVYFWSEDTYLYALDARSGQEKWRHLIKGVGCTLAVSDGVVYFGGLGAFDAQTGQPLWGVEAGVAFSLSIAGDVAYVGCSPYGFSAFMGLYTVDLDGEQPPSQSSVTRWANSGLDLPLAIRGSVAIVDGVAYYASVYENSFDAVELRTLQRKWSFRTGDVHRPDPGLDHGAAIVSPAVAGGLLYGGSEGGPLYALDIENGRERWRFAMDITQMSSPAVSGQVLYVGSKDGYLYALNATTGKQDWSFKTGDAISTSPAIADGVVYFASDDGYLYAVR